MHNNESPPGASTSSTDPVSFPEHPTESKAISRRRLLTRGAVAGGLLWVAPTIDSFSAASAQGTGPQPDPTATTAVFKHQNASPSVTTVCVSGSTASAVRGSAVFTRILAANTIRLTVTINNGPAIPTRQIVLLQSTTAGCLTPINLVEGVLVPDPPPPMEAWPVWGPGGLGTRTYEYPILAGATHFSLALLESGGGGTDTYTTARVLLPAP